MELYYGTVILSVVDAATLPAVKLKSRNRPNNTKHFTSAYFKLKITASHSPRLEFIFYIVDTDFKR